MISSKDKRADDAGVSLPLVFLALFAFSFMVIMLVTVTQLSLKSGESALKRSETGAAIEAGVQDFLFRVDNDNSLSRWDARKALPFRRGHPSPTRFPAYVRESAFGIWRKVPHTENEFFTYDLINLDDSSNPVLRVTGRTDRATKEYRTFEVEVKLPVVPKPALSVESAWASPEQYRSMTEHGVTFNMGAYDLWGMTMSGNLSAGTLRNGKLWPDEYDSICTFNPNTEFTSHSKYLRCMRQTMSGVDAYKGDLVLRGPMSVHGSKSWFGEGRQSADPKYQPYRDWPIITGNILMEEPKKVGRKDAFAITSKMLPADSYAGGLRLQHWPDIYYGVNDREVRAQGYNITYTQKPNPYKAGNPVKADDLIARADCVFSGATQIVMDGRDFYVLSPHTPSNLNRGKERWCSRPARQLWGKYRKIPAISAATLFNPLRSYRGDVALRDPQQRWRTDLSSNTMSDFSNNTDGFNADRDYTPNYTRFRVPEGKVIAVVRANQCWPQRSDFSSDWDYNRKMGEFSTFNKTRIGYPHPHRGALIDQKEFEYTCEDGDLFVDGIVDGKFSLVSENDIFLTGGIRYKSRYSPRWGNKLHSGSDDILGLVAKKNVKVYYPMFSGAEELRWPRTDIPPLFFKEDSGAAISFRGYLHGRDRAEVENYIMDSPDSYMIDRGYNDPRKWDRTKYWWPLTQYDAVIVAETGYFGLMDPGNIRWSDKPSNLLSLTVNGGVFTRYRGINHYEALWGGVLRYKGLHENFNYDTRLDFMQPPGFDGLIENSGIKARVLRVAEVYDRDVPGCYEEDGSRSVLPENPTFSCP